MGILFEPFVANLLVLGQFLDSDCLMKSPVGLFLVFDIKVLFLFTALIFIVLTLFVFDVFFWVLRLDMLVRDDLMGFLVVFLDDPVLGGVPYEGWLGVLAGFPDVFLFIVLFGGFLGFALHFLQDVVELLINRFIFWMVRASFLQKVLAYLKLVFDIGFN